MGEEREVYGYKEIYYAKEEEGEPREEIYRITSIEGPRIEIKDRLYREIGSNKEKFKGIIRRIDYRDEIRMEDIEYIERLIKRVKRGIRRYKRGKYYKNVMKEG